LRFCMITTFYPPHSFGGDGVYVRWLAHELAQRGHHVEVVHCIDAYRSMARGEAAGLAVEFGAANQPDHTSKSDVIVHGLRSRFGPLSPLATHQTGKPVFKAARLQEILRAGFDVIHYHNISLVGGPGVLTLGQGIKLYTLHEYWLVCPTHLLFRYGRATCPGADWRCLFCTLIYRRPPQWWRYTGLLRDAARHVDVFIAPSKFCLDKHREMGLSRPMVHLPNFAPEQPASSVTEPFIGPMPPGRPAGDEPYFLYVGRLEKIKGLQTLIPVFDGSNPASLWVAGAGSCEPDLRRLAGGSVRFLGYQSGPRLRSLIRDAVALIVPSLVWEIAPLVILEAFREKTPVIVRHQGGMPEMVEASGGGFVYRTEGELTTAIRQLLTDRRLRDDMGQRGHAAFQSNWTADVHLDRYLKLIHGMMNRPAAGTDRPEKRLR